MLGTSLEVGHHGETMNEIVKKAIVMEDIMMTRGIQEEEVEMGVWPTHLLDLQNTVLYITDLYIHVT